MTEIHILENLEESSQKGWTVVNMKDDWNKVYNSDK